MRGGRRREEKSRTARCVMCRVELQFKRAGFDEVDLQKIVVPVRDRISTQQLCQNTKTPVLDVVAGEAGVVDRRKVDARDRADRIRNSVSFQPLFALSSEQGWGAHWRSTGNVRFYGQLDFPR